MASMIIMALALQAPLPAGAEASAQPVISIKPAAAAKGAPEKMICKRQVRTGSLASVERTCYTRAEWQRLADQTRDAWQEMQGVKGSTRE